MVEGRDLRCMFNYTEYEAYLYKTHKNKFVKYLFTKKNNKIIIIQFFPTNGGR